MSPPEPAVEIAPLTTEKQFRDVVALQQTIWGFEDLELLPFRFFVVAEKVGGQILGAYSGGRMIGFCLGIPGLKPDGLSFLHSHMLGVLPGYRDAGVGRALKLRQREDALARGIDLIEWTFDPLELKNAWFNIERLGAIVRRYIRNQYGVTSSPLHGSLPTDRGVAEWWIASERVHRIVNGEPFPPPQIVERIAVPADIGEIRRTDRNRAVAIQAEMADRFERSFARGLAVVGFSRTPGSGAYLLGEAA